MRIAGAGASRRLRWGLFSLVATIAVTAVTSDPADARTRRKRVVHHRAAVHHSSAASSYSPPYSDIVLDVNSGAVLHASSPDSPRHPASLTKIMTLYLLFERLESGKFRLDTPLNVSAHAAMQAPSKLGVKPGQTIAVEDAIKAIVTRSANDVAVVVAEAIGGDEDNFATVMTRKARALGMSRTTYVNASGLPADDQITTARDQALLGRAIQDRFPRYYPYFQTTAFRYRGNVIGNHNHLLGRVAGVDGIKTGYTRASGFNLVTSVRRNNRQLVAVVLGGRSAGSRDARMQELINENIAVASVKRTAPMVAEVAAEPAPAAPAAPRNPVQRVMAAVITPAKADPAPTAAIPTQRTAPGSNDPLQPIMVRTVSVKPAAIRTASLGPLPASATLASASAQVAVAPVKAAAPEVARADLDVPPPARAGTLGTLPVRVASAAAQMPAAAESPAASHAAHRDGWMIQIGAFDRETEAKQRLSAAQDRARALLGTADPFTERVVKGDKALYRARFAGLDKDKAEAACQYLKRNEIVCMTIKN